MAMGVADKVGRASVKPPLALQTTWWQNRLANEYFKLKNLIFCVQQILSL